MLSSFTATPLFGVQKSKSINFTGGIKSFRNPIKPKKIDAPFGDLTDISLSQIEAFNQYAYKKGLSNNDLLKALFKIMPHMPKVKAVESKNAIVGNTRVHTLIDGEQIFDKTMEIIKYATKSIQIEMFEFQNLSVDGHRWVTGGAERVAGADKQQKILYELLKKKQAHPNIKIQVILDAHKWYIDGHGKKVKHYGNQDMIRYLKQKGIDVVPYPRASQGGSALQHIKLLIVDGKDGKKAILGGMNWGSHSAANHDACIALETLPGKKNSEIDNLIDHHFNPDWELAWKKLGETKFVNGPVKKEEQKGYNGLDKEIKQENVDYMKLVGELFDNPTDRSRYQEGKLDLIPTHPIQKPQIKILGTKPKELEEIGKKGDESTREYLLEKIRTCKKMRAQLFVLTDKEIVETVIKRVKNKELDARFVISSDILKFPYCRMAYHILRKNNIPIRVYKVDKSINQRLHSKWAVFDDKEVMIGSTNWSGMGLNHNLHIGFRDDYTLNSQKIQDEIEEYADEVRDFEQELGIPPLKDLTDYDALVKRRKKFKKVINDLEKHGKASIELRGKVFKFTMKESSTINTIHGYYGLMKKRFNAKEKYKRGNNEISVVFESPELAKKVFGKQFDLDWEYSESKFDTLKRKTWGVKKADKTEKSNNSRVKPTKLDRIG